MDEICNGLAPVAPAPPPVGVVVAHDRRFATLVRETATLRRIMGGLLWAEGPVWFADGGFLLCSDIPSNRILRWIDGVGMSLYRAPSRHANGNTRDRQGRLVTCEHESRSVTRTEPDGRVTVLAAAHEGRRLNSPNDVVVSGDGAVWFTDPSYGIMSDYEGSRAEPELAGRYVFRIDPGSGALRVVADDFLQPNGLAFSPDERTLYIADSGASDDPAAPRHIRAFDVADGRLTNGRVFARIEQGVPDGIRVDGDGNLWSSAADGVHCFAPDGTPLGKVCVPETVSNLTFGGPRRNVLYITATTGVYAITTGIRGAQTP